jgi:hypothetical protein
MVSLRQEEATAKSKNGIIKKALEKINLHIVKLV